MVKGAVDPAGVGWLKVDVAMPVLCEELHVVGIAHIVLVEKIVEVRVMTWALQL